MSDTADASGTPDQQSDQQPNASQSAIEPKNSRAKQETTKQENLLAGLVEKGVAIGAAVGGTAQQVGQTAIEKAADASNSLAETTRRTGKAVFGSAASVGGAIGSKAAQTGGATLELAKWLGEAAGQQSYQVLSKTTSAAGQVASFIGSSWMVRRLSGTLKLDWLVGIINQVDLDKAESAVRKLQQQHPDESASQIAHRLMLEKAIYAGGTGLASSLLPGTAIALLAVDLAATAALQSEMVYQIAAAYGMDLDDPARKGEVMAIFGLALGGGRAVKAGLGFLRTVPVAGAIIGASTNATMIYALGYAARRFYEAKQQETSADPTPETLDSLQQASDRYLETAIEQQTVMDQILVHMIIASYPQKSWQDILPNLEALKLSPASVEAIASSIESPQPLDHLLAQLNQDYAVSLLAQCYKIAELDGKRSQPENAVIDAIVARFSAEVDEFADTKIKVSD